MYISISTSMYIYLQMYVVHVHLCLYHYLSFCLRLRLYPRLHLYPCRFLSSFLLFCCVLGCCVLSQCGACVLPFLSRHHKFQHLHCEKVDCLFLLVSLCLVHVRWFGVRLQVICFLRSLLHMPACEWCHPNQRTKLENKQSELT